MNALAELAGDISAFAWRRFDIGARDVLRQRVFDTLGSLALGLATEEGRALKAITQRLAGGEKLSPIDSVLLLTGATRSTETDDIDISSCTTVGSVVVPVALTAADAYGCTDEDTLTAVAAGYEAISRFGRAIDGANLLYRGVWPTYVAAPVGAAAVTASLLRLDASRTFDALSLALVRTAWLQAHPMGGVSPRSYLLGRAAADGFAAAVAAANGLGGSADALDAFERAAGFAVDRDELVSDAPGFSRCQEVDSKPFPTSRQGLATIQAFLQLLPAGAPDEIEWVNVSVPSQYRAMLDRQGQPRGRQDSLVSVRYQMALAAFAPKRLFDGLRMTLPWDNRFAAFGERVSVHEDRKLTSLFPRRWPGRVEVRWRSGPRLEAEVIEPEGSAAQPLGWNGLQAKLERIFQASGLDTAGFAGLAEACRGLATDERLKGAGALLRQAAAIAETASDKFGTEPANAAI